MLSSFETRASGLRDLLTLRTLGSDAFPALERVELLLTSLEGDVSSVRGAIMSESAFLTEAAELLKRAQKCGTEISSMSVSLPLLPGDMDDVNGGVHTRPPLQELGNEAATINSAADQHRPPPPPPAATPSSRSATHPAAAPASGRGGGASSRPASSRTPPQLALVTEHELESAPSYMRSRLDVSKVNQALMEIQKALASKYTLLSTPAATVRTMGESERKRHAAYKALEGDATKGLYFFSEEDMKAAVPSVKNDATGKNLIAVLRHVGRLKEFKHGGMRCWQTRN